MGGTTVHYTVPSGYRAVITSICASTFLTAPTDVWVAVNMKPFWFYRFLASPAAQTVALRAVAYQLESIDAFIQHPEDRVFVSGFLFTDPGGSIVPHAELDYELGNTLVEAPAPDVGLPRAAPVDPAA